MPFDTATVSALFSELSEDRSQVSIPLRGASAALLAALFENGVVKVTDFTALHQESFLDAALALAAHLPEAEAARLPLALLDAGVDPWATATPERVVLASLAPSLRAVLARVCRASTRPAQWDALPLRLPGLGDEPLPLLAALASVRSQAGDVGIALDAGADPNRVIAPGRTVVAYAGRPEALSRLLAAGGRMAHSGWHEHQASRKNQQKWGELVPLAAAALVREGHSAYGPEWDPLIDRALKSLTRKEGASDLWQALSRHWEQAPVPLRWRMEPLVGWDLDAALAHQALLNVRTRNATTTPVFQEWREPSLRSLTVDPKADWARQNRPGVPNGVWPALHHWCRRAGAENFRERWLASDPSFFWAGVLGVLDEWEASSVWWPVRTVILATVTLSRAAAIPGFPQTEIAARRTAWVETFLAGKNAVQDAPQAGPLESLLRTEASAVLASRSEEGLGRVVRMLALSIGTDLQKHLLETLDLAQKAGLRATVGEDAPALFAAIRARLRPGRRPVFDAWQLGNDLPDPTPAGSRLRL